MIGLREDRENSPSNPAAFGVVMLLIGYKSLLLTVLLFGFMNYFVVFSLVYGLFNES